MDEVFQRRLIAMETEIFDAISSKTQFSTFNDRFIVLLDEFQVNHRSGLLSQETLTLFHDVVARLEVILESCGELETDLDVLESSVVEVDTLFSELNITNGLLEEDLVPFQEMALNWLLYNLVYPYPSQKQQSVFCNATGTSSDEVQRWFKKTRRAIGWTSLCQKCFKGSKKALASALRSLPVIVEQADPALSELCASFGSIRENAEKMFTQAMTSQQHLVPCHKDEVRNSFSPSDDLGPSLDLKRKREWSSPPVKSKANKRSRLVSTPIDARLSASSSSPAASILEAPKTTRKRSFASVEEECYVPCRRRPPPQSSIATSKRCLSDSDNQIQRKRPTGQYQGRCQVVSDPIPSSILFPDLGSNPWEDSNISLAESCSTKLRTEEKSKLVSSHMLLSSDTVPLQAMTSTLLPETKELPTVMEQTFTTPSQLLFDCGLTTSLHDNTALSPPLDIQLHSWTSLESDDTALTPAVVDLPSELFLLPSTFNWLSHPISDEPCPELDYSTTPSSVADSPLPDLGTAELSEKFRKLHEHQEAAKKLEAEISAAARIVT